MMFCDRWEKRKKLIHAHEQDNWNDIFLGGDWNWESLKGKERERNRSQNYCKRLAWIGVLCEAIENNEKWRQKRALTDTNRNGTQKHFSLNNLFLLGSDFIIFSSALAGIDGTLTLSLPIRISSSFYIRKFAFSRIFASHTKDSFIVSISCVFYFDISPVILFLHKKLILYTEYNQCYWEFEVCYYSIWLSFFFFYFKFYFRVPLDKPLSFIRRSEDEANC